MEQTLFGEKCPDLWYWLISKILSSCYLIPVHIHFLSYLDAPGKELQRPWPWLDRRKLNSRRKTLWSLTHSRWLVRQKQWIKLCMLSLSGVNSYICTTCVCISDQRSLHTYIHAHLKTCISEADIFSLCAVQSDCPENSDKVAVSWPLFL